MGLVGMALLVIGSFLMTQVGVGTSQLIIGTSLGLMGLGMGLSIPAFLLAVQSTVQRKSLGTATSTVQFSRSIGGTFGVSLMGLALSLGLASSLRGAGVDPASVSVEELLNPLAATTIPPALEETLRVALANAMQWVFMMALVAAVLGLIAVAFAPSGRIAQLRNRQAPSEEQISQPAIH
jgi:hypothetical protein